MCNQKGGVQPTYSTINSPQRTPDAQPDLHLPHCIQTSNLLNTRSVYWLLYMHTTNHKHITYGNMTKYHRIPVPTFLHSHTQIPAKSILILHCRLFTLRKHKLSSLPKFQTFQSSSNLSLKISAATTSLKPPGTVEQDMHSAKVAQLQILHPHYVHQNSAFLRSTNPSISLKLSS
jgi:hypothetical protein